MATFHDDKLWQEAYVACLDLLEATGDSGSDVVEQVRKHAMVVLTTIADGLGRRDRREHDTKLRDAGNMVVALRSLLSVLWGQEVLTDEQLGKLDGAYEALSGKLPK